MTTDNQPTQPDFEALAKSFLKITDTMAQDPYYQTMIECKALEFKWFYTSGEWRKWAEQEGVTKVVVNYIPYCPDRPIPHELASLRAENERIREELKDILEEAERGMYLIPHSRIQEVVNNIDANRARAESLLERRSCDTKGEGK